MKVWKFRWKYKVHRFLHAEYWPMWTFYVPMTFYFVILIIRNRSLGFFSAVNPGLKLGGLTLEGKDEQQKILPAGYLPESVFVNANADEVFFMHLLERLPFGFPCIAKPNDGYRGQNVVLVFSKDDLLQYKRDADFDFLIQEYIDLPHEIGLFYGRLPSESQGQITGISYKKGIVVRGDGRSSLGKLVQENLRYHGLFESLFKNDAQRAKIIPAAGEEVCLSTIGNHARGATFYDAGERITPELVNTFDRFADKIPGFNYGRFDIKFSTWEALEAGDFRVIELNGAGAEPTHMYHPSYSYWQMLAIMKTHWKLMGRIASENAALGHNYADLHTCLQVIHNWILPPALQRIAGRLSFFFDWN